MRGPTAAAQREARERAQRLGVTPVAVRRPYRSLRPSHQSETEG